MARHEDQCGTGDLVGRSFFWESTKQRPGQSQCLIISQRDVLVQVSLEAEAEARIQVQII